MYALAFNANEKYLPYLAVLLTSIIHNTKQDSNKMPYSFYLLIDKISKESEEKLENLILELSKIYPCTLKIHLMNEDIFQQYNLPKLNGNYLAYYRLLIGSVLEKEIESVLYLDVDMLVLSDLREIFTHMDIMRGEGGICGVVLDYLDTTRTLIPHTKDLPLLSGDFAKNYFNSGLLLMDLNAWRMQNLEEKALQIAKNYSCIEHDQSILNAALLDKTYKLPLKWNLLVYLYCNAKSLEEKKPNISYFKEELKEALQSPCILHFYTSHKPWEDAKVYVDYKGKFLGEYWWEMARKTPIFYAELKELEEDAKNAKNFQINLGFKLYKIAKIFSVFSIFIIPFVVCFMVKDKQNDVKIPMKLYNLCYEIGRATLYAYDRRRKGKLFSLSFKIFKLIRRFRKL
ncbi:glycosyltransferase family 8 protein [Helicobacter burdigaliensis]|uniref:glycosyltransferase family 8 protein n=1 Tax=Helicobacter burdigaliensis TaxID=2315334 RepID=UPI000EF69E30|nr:glycosyltransferase family 8 protein [Helicobacter burdigaliensis]